jgi:nucleoside-diphosphate-sugar epimerase
MQQNCEDDRLAIEAIGEALAGSGKPLIGTSGVLGVTSDPNHPVDEDDVKELSSFPRVSEEATLATIDKGVKGIVMRLSQIHDREKAGLVSFAIMLGFQKGKLAYVGEGGQRWAAAHVSDTARLYRLALEKGEAGSRWHAVGEGGVTSKNIMETLSKRLGLPAVSISPEEAAAVYGFLGHFMNLDSPTSNTKTRERLGWNPTGPTLLEDLSNLVLPEAVGAAH